MEDHNPISKELDEIGKMIVNAAFEVHRELGPGLVEPLYETCFEEELRNRGLQVHRQLKVPIHYKGKPLKQPLRLDLLVEKLIIVEDKAVEALIPLHHAQLLSYLKLTNLRLGYLINFHVPLIKNGIKRVVR